MGFYRFPKSTKLKLTQTKHLALRVKNSAFRQYLAALKFETTRCLDLPGMQEDRTAYGMRLMELIKAAEDSLMSEFTDEEVDQMYKDASCNPWIYNCLKAYAGSKGMHMKDNESIIRPEELTHRESDSFEKLQADIDKLLRDLAADTDTADEIERRFTALIERGA